MQEDRELIFSVWGRKKTTLNSTLSFINIATWLYFLSKKLLIFKLYVSFIEENTYIISLQLEL